MLSNLRVFAASLFALSLLGPVENTNAQDPAVRPGEVIISELRFRGPGGPEDEFIELYNNTDRQIIVQAVDTSAGWSILISGQSVSGQPITGPICNIPNGTLLQPRGHFLCANANGYSLSGYPSGYPVASETPSAAAVSPFPTTTPDLTYTLDIPDGFGVALFNTQSVPNQSAANRLDAFGFTGSPALFKEGNGFPTLALGSAEHTYFRDLRSGTPKDTNDNANDFRLVATAPNIATSLLGAPGPENGNSPIATTLIPASLLDPSAPATASPNRERRPNVEPNANLGTLRIRRTFTNNTGLPVIRLRFRVINITTLGTPASECGGTACADVRAISSDDAEAGVGGQIVTVKGVTLEEPPSQPLGGGHNASLSADFITLGTPLAPGQSVNIEFKLGVMMSGPFRFFISIEAQTGQTIIPVRS